MGCGISSTIKPILISKSSNNLPNQLINKEKPELNDISQKSMNSKSHNYSQFSKIENQNKELKNGDYIGSKNINSKNQIDSSLITHKINSGIIFLLKFFRKKRNF